LTASADGMNFLRALDASYGFAQFFWAQSNLTSSTSAPS